MPNSSDYAALWLTFQVAGLATLLLLLLGTPLAGAGADKFVLERCDQQHRGFAVGVAAHRAGVLFVGADGAGRPYR